MRDGVIDPIEISSNNLLIYAASNDVQRLTSTLLIPGIDFIVRNAAGDTALHIACRLAHVDCAQAIINITVAAAATAVLLTMNNASESPLMLAAAAGSLPIVRDLCFNV